MSEMNQELEAVWLELEQRGYSRRDFQFTPVHHANSTAGEVPSPVDVKVTRSTGPAMTYKVWRERPWYEEFISDLESGYYGPPDAE